MRLALLCPRPARIVLGCLAALLLPALASPGNTIDVRLNVNYEIPTDPLSGGTWNLEAKSGGFGIFSLSLRLTGIDTVTPVGPTGVVEEIQSAGFTIFNNAPFAGHRNVFIGQRYTSPETLFYGVGTLMNGSPQFPTKPVEWNAIGPSMPDLTDLENVPWAPGPSDPLDTAWDLAATLLTGTFADGVTPAFFTDAEEGYFSTGNVFTSVGTLSSPGSFTNVNPLTSAIVRTNLMTNMANADYNNDGFVNAADYTVWRNTRGSTTVLDADGSGPSGLPDGLIDSFDYQFWKDHFGETIPGSGAISGDLSVPEPGTAWLLIVGTLFGLFSQRVSRSPALAAASHVSRRGQHSQEHICRLQFVPSWG